MKTNICITMDIDVLTKLDEEAKRLGLPRGFLVQQAVKDKLAQEDRRWV